MEILAERPADSSSAQPETVRHNFGKKKHAWMQVEIGGDAQEATLEKLSFEGDTSLGGKDVLETLENQYGFQEENIDKDAVEDLASRAQASPNQVVSGEHTVARGFPPEPGEPGRMDFPFLDGIDDAVKPHCAALKAAFAEPTLESVLQHDLLTRLVVPREELVVLGPPKRGRPGRDIYGHIVTGEVQLRAGAHIIVEGNRFLSRIYGYGCIIGEEISVVSPLWISPDHMQAHFIHLPPVAAELTPRREWLLQLLQVRNITHGILESAIEKLCAGALDKSGSASMLVARGAAATPGSDASVEFTFNKNRKTSRYLPDGSVDLAHHPALARVEKGQILGTIQAATTGQPGYDLKGRKIPSKAGHQETLKANQHVGIENQDGLPKFFYAKIAGVARVDDTTVWVQPLFLVNGDVDEKTRAIEVEDSVYISGSVRSGLTVKSGGSIIVEGMVEAGATVSAQGDIIVAKSIVGESTRIVALATVEARSIQDSSVIARGDITLGSYIYNGSVRSGGKLTVHEGGGKRGGSIVGGQTYATIGIEAHMVGSASTNTTLVGIGPDPEIAARLLKLDKGIEHCLTQIMRIFRTLDLNEIEADQFKALIDRTPVPKRPMVMKVLRQLKDLGATRDKAKSNRKKLEEQSATTIESAKIKIFDQVFTDVKITMGEKSLRVGRDLQNVVFSLQSPHGVVSRPL
jgi:uncharacterized protein (DUF342 family)